MADVLARGLMVKLGVALAIGLAAALVAALTAASEFGTTVELKTYDWRVRFTTRDASPSPHVAVVAIDEDSIRRMEPLVGRWPWPRLAHASLVDFLAKGGATLVVYDVLFTERDRQRFTLGGETAPDGTVSGGEEWTGAESDRAFAAAIAKAGNVLLAADARFEGLLDERRARPEDRRVPLPVEQRSCFDVRPDLTTPMPELRAGARAVGHTFLTLDADGVARRFVPFVQTPAGTAPALSIAAAALARGIDPASLRQHGRTLQLGATAIPLVDQQIVNADGVPATVCRALIPFRGPLVGDQQRRAFAEYSFYDLFFSEYQMLQGEKPSIEPSEFKNRIVVVGATASGTFDLFTIPHGQGAPGAYIHASVIDAVLDGRTTARASLGRGLGVTAAAALTVAFMGAMVSPWLLALGAAAVGGVVLALTTWWFEAGLWSPLLEPLMAVGLAFVGQLAWQYAVEGREKRQVKRLFSRYVPKDVYEQLIQDPSRAALGGTRRTMTVLFSDVRGFTSMSEKATPEEVVQQLNEYFTRMVAVLFAHRGTLDKFVGDMVMGLFSAPLDDPDHADHAVQAALKMVHELAELNRGWRAAGRAELEIGIGISTGDMVAGNIGSDTIMSYTVIGDTVNLGARLESLNKDYGTHIIISEATRAALKRPYSLRPLGDVTVKGKSRPVAIYEVIST